MMMRPLLLLAVLLLAGCGGTEDKITSRPAVSYADIQPAAGMNYEEFRKHGDWGQGDIAAAHKRFLILDRDNNGVISLDEASD